MSRWGTTKKQRLAQQRNWCKYMLKGMEALTQMMASQGWLTHTAANNLQRSITSASYSVDACWYEKEDRL